MQVTGSIEYKTEHGNNGVYIVATWDVPYAGWTKGEHITEVEVSGEVLLHKLQLFAGNIERELALPVGPMLAEFVKAYEKSVEGCEVELAELFCEDIRDNHNFEREQQYARERDWAHSA